MRLKTYLKGLVHNMNKNSKIIILRGNSGSGKTTVAKSLQNKFRQIAMILEKKRSYGRRSRPPVCC